MLTLQPNHQVVYHLSQLSNCLSATTSQIVNGFKTLNTQKTTNSQDQSDIICKESLDETIKNYTNDLVICLPKISKKTHKSNSKFTSGKSTSSEIEELRRAVQILSPLKPLPSNKRLQAPWEVSFISTDSFEGNKRLGFQKLPSASTCSSIYNLTSKNLDYTLFHMKRLDSYQKRGFKTERIVDKEKERNSSASSRLYYLFFKPPKPEIKPIPSLEKFVDAKNVDAVATALVKVYGEGYTAGKSSEKLKKLRLFISGIFAAILVIFGLRAFMVMKNFPFTDNIKRVSPDEIDVTFADVRGSEEVKKELITVVNFLKNPKKFAVLGAKLPKGVLLVGEPGVGKTLLARAVAGEARVPFFYASGSEFDEILVGEGARRIRNLFRIAKENAPCVIFVDEIDSVGAKRAKSSVHPYANQSINQLLSEMDGFASNEGVVVLAATNRASDLDKALVRPGRFDMAIEVPSPRKGDRRDIIQYYLKKITCRNIDIDVLVKMTPGWNGANLQNLLNWAAILAATENSEYVNMHHILSAYDRIVLGVSWGAANANELQKDMRRIAYHEAGHTLVSLLTPGSKTIHKVTIEARGSALGHTAQLEDDEALETKAALTARVDVCFGGQVAEEFIYGPEEVSGGCSSDLVAATSIAKTMVRKFGMGATNRHLDDSESLSGEAQTAIDKDIDKILNESKERAKSQLANHAADLHKIAGALLEYKTLSRADLMEILGKTDVSCVC
ncbi:hypothetical protein ONE63_004612 [Megalurothrips usitatus]|uniref:AAA+ ATPase domain-containing protein n=1 Tax=Megalurothrips usitatus TaxID=439358 RepID=A0AAV7X092_9NEOP|nr:hypothetical protein ONE63_004612 [Megalurothrips usitatus]